EFDLVPYYPLVITALLLLTSIIIAGGLDPENVTEAIRVTRPDAVDVASGVESAPGLKDHSKLDGFFGAAHYTPVGAGEGQ
ncbi:MAG: hypothetical protein ACERKT_08715, partial [Acidobacteriota bacterium]